MSTKTVTIDHPHAEVIAAYYSGKAVQLWRGGEWLDYKGDEKPQFATGSRYRIKPEPLVRWVVFDSENRAQVVFAVKASAEDFAGGVGCYRIVRMVEQPE